MISKTSEALVYETKDKLEEEAFGRNKSAALQTSENTYGSLSILKKYKKLTILHAVSNKLGVLIIKFSLRLTTSLWGGGDLYAMVYINSMTRLVNILKISLHEEEVGEMDMNIFNRTHIISRGLYPKLEIHQNEDMTILDQTVNKRNGSCTGNGNITFVLQNDMEIDKMKIWFQASSVRSRIRSC